MGVEYKDHEVVVNYSRWNARSHAYDSNLKKSVYQLDDAQDVLLASVKYGFNNIEKSVTEEVYSL